MNNLLKVVIETNLQIQKKARDMNIRAGERIFLIMSRSEWKAWLMERLQGARSVAEITDLDLLYLPPLDSAIIGEIMAENPDTIEVEGETLEIKYEQDWLNRFVCSITVSEELVRRTSLDKLYLPSGRSVLLYCGRYEAYSVAELVEKLEKQRIEKAWEIQRRAKERNSWLHNPEDVIPYLSQLGPVEITRGDNGEGEPVVGYLSLYSDSCPAFLIKLRENREEAERETRIALERLIQADCGNIFAVPKEEPWQRCSYSSWYKSSAGEILERKLGEVMVSFQIGLSSENYAKKVEQAKKGVLEVKRTLQEEYVALEDFLFGKERGLDNMISSISSKDFRFVKTEAFEAREEMERAKELLNEMKYQEARAACIKALELAGPLDFLSRKRRGEYDRANDKWRPVAEVLRNIAEACGMFREATETEKEQANKILEEVSGASDNNDFGLVIEKALEANSWVKIISSLCSERVQKRRERYPEGVWEAASCCDSDNPEEIADRGIELAKCCSDSVGEKDTLYFLRSLTVGNMSKYEKQRELLEFVSGLEEIEVGKWFNGLHYADDINSAIEVGIAYLESKKIKEQKGGKIEDIASQLAATFGGANVRIKTKKIK